MLYINPDILDVKNDINLNLLSDTIPNAVPQVTPHFGLNQIIDGLHPPAIPHVFPWITPNIVLVLI